MGTEGEIRSSGAGERKLLAQGVVTKLNVSFRYRKTDMTSSVLMRGGN
jgi:hypothetical protein